MSTPWGGRRAQRAVKYVLNRDAGICWICGHPGADTLDHITPRSTAPERTWDPTNWAAAHGQAQPAYNCPGQYARGNHPAPRRPDTTTANIHIITGPPCAGKTTWTNQQRNPADIILDTDALAQALGSTSHHTSTGHHATAARHAHQTLIEKYLTTPPDVTVWIIQTAPTPQQITRYKNTRAQHTLIDPGPDLCLKRAKQERQHWTIPAIHDWYKHDQQRLQAWKQDTPTPPATSGRKW